VPISTQSLIVKSKTTLSDGPIKRKTLFRLGEDRGKTRRT